MNADHTHLLLNHIPVLGPIIGAILLTFGLLRRYVLVAQAGLAVIAVTALFVLPVANTGHGAEHLIEHLPGISIERIEAHEAAAERALYPVLGLAMLAAVSFYGYQVRTTWARSLSMLTLVCSIAAMALLARAAVLGGQISHPLTREK